MRDSVTLALVLTLLALATTSSSGQLVPAASPDMVTADSLIALYLRLENALWQVVRSTTADTADKIKRIHETHLTLLETDFREKGMPLDRLDADQAQLYNAIAYINMTQRSVLNGYLHENARDRTRDNALTFARHGVNMSQNLERIFNVTETMDFYNYIARVSCRVDAVQSNIPIFTATKSLRSFGSAASCRAANWASAPCNRRTKCCTTTTTIWPSPS